jgi:hypothetical protein
MQGWVKTQRSHTACCMDSKRVTWGAAGVRTEGRSSSSREKQPKEGVSDAALIHAQDVERAKQGEKPGRDQHGMPLNK